MPLIDNALTNQQLRESAVPVYISSGLSIGTIDQITTVDSIHDTVTTSGVSFLLGGTVNTVDAITSLDTLNTLNTITNIVPTSGIVRGGTLDTLTGITNTVNVAGTLTSVSSISNLVTISGVVGQGPPQAQLFSQAWPVKLVDSNNRTISVDSATNTIQVLEYEHHEVHGGSAYSASYNIDVTGLGTNYDFLAITPNTTKWIHMRWEYTTEAEFVICIHENNTISNNGSVLPSFNRNRNSLNTAGLLLYRAPTVSVLGTDIRCRRTGSGSTVGGGFLASNEWVFKQNTNYIFRFTKQASGTHYISIRFWWYEHTDKTS